MFAFERKTLASLGAVLGTVIVLLLTLEVAMKFAGACHCGFHLGWQPGTVRTLGALLFACRIMIGRRIASM